jgi:hypothetical protein
LPYRWLLKGKANKISLSLATEVIKRLDPAGDMQVDEMECIVANLIFQVSQPLPRRR